MDSVFFLSGSYDKNFSNASTLLLKQNLNADKEGLNSYFHVVFFSFLINMREFLNQIRYREEYNIITEENSTDTTALQYSGFKIFRLSLNKLVCVHEPVSSGT